MSEPTYKYLHTTQVPVQTTASQMMAILGILGAGSVSMDMAEGEPSGMTFSVPMGDRFITYRLPVKWKPIAATMLKEAQQKRGWHGGRTSTGQKTVEITLQAKRTAWRLALDWLKVQAAFVQNGVRSAHEVFLADLEFVKDGKTTTVGEYLIGNSGAGLLRLAGGQ